MYYYFFIISWKFVLNVSTKKYYFYLVIVEKEMNSQLTKQKMIQ